jgi:type IV pilus assembly protein PilV
MKKVETGFFLIEAMVAVLIFALGILGMVAMGSAAVGAQSDARYRTDAEALTDEMASTIALSVDRSSDAALQASVLTFQHQPTGAPASCAFSGAPSAVASVGIWAGRAYTVGAGLPGLPGADATEQQILVTSTAQVKNQVQITVCWKSPTDSVARHNTLTTYIN